jgi:hypothetical protein
MEAFHSSFVSGADPAHALRHALEANNTPLVHAAALACYGAG